MILNQQLINRASFLGVKNSTLQFFKTLNKRHISLKKMNHQKYAYCTTQGFADHDQIYLALGTPNGLPFAIRMFEKS